MGANGNGSPTHHNPVAGSRAATIAWELTSDGYGQCVGFSEGAADLLGYSADEVVGSEDIFDQIIEPADIPFERARAARSFREGPANVSTRLGECQKKEIIAKDGHHIMCAVCGEIATCMTKSGHIGLAMVSTWVPLRD